ncbi:hypothetical protein D9B01_18915 [Salmonella enterica]|nr:hypothetical protein [Salmonella enterica]
MLILEQGQSDRDLIKCVELRLSDAGMEFALGYFGSGCSALSWLVWESTAVAEGVKILGQLFVFT